MRNYGGQVSIAAQQGRRSSAPRVPATLYDLTDYAVEPLVYRVGVQPFFCNGAPPTLGGTALDAATAPALTVLHNDLVYLQVVGTFGAGTPAEPDTYVQTIERMAASASSNILNQELTPTGFIGRLPLGGVLVADGRLTLSTRGQSSAWARVECDATSVGVYFWSF